MSLMLTVKNALGRFKEIPLRGTKDGVAVFTQSNSSETAQSRTISCKAGDTVLVPGTDLSALLASNLVHWDGFSADSKTVSFIGTSSEDTTNEMLGWVVVINPGSPTIARMRVLSALSSVGFEPIAKYVPGATVHGNTNKGCLLIPRIADFQFTNIEDVTDIYIAPIGSVTGAGLNGEQLLMVVVS